MIDHQAVPAWRDWRFMVEVARRTPGAVSGMRGQKAGFVFATGALVIAPQGLGHEAWFKFHSRVRNSSNSSINRFNAMLSVRLRRTYNQSLQRRKEWKGETSVLQMRRRGFDEVAAVADQIPVLRETAQALHRGEINQLWSGEFRPGRMRAVNHLPLGVVPDDGRAAESLEDANWISLRAQSDQTKSPNRSWSDLRRANRQ